jgi:hypothetical protein
MVAAARATAPASARTDPKFEAMFKCTADLMEHIEVVDLKINQRARLDPAWVAVIDSLRSPVVTHMPLVDFVEKHLADHILTPTMVTADPSWRDAPVLVTGNAARHKYVQERAGDVAFRLRVPVLRWRVPFANAELEQVVAPDLLDALQRDNPCLTGYFIAGANAFLTQNIRPEREVSNGTPVTYHSLVFDPADWGGNAALFDAFLTNLDERIRAAAPGSYIDLPHPPYAINVELTGRNAAAYADVTVVPGAAVIAVLRRPEDPTTLYKFVTGTSIKNIVLAAHAVAPAMACTYYKAQGRTMRKVIVDFNQSNCPLGLAAVFVGMSRVCRGIDFAVITPYRAGSD